MKIQRRFSAKKAVRWAALCFGTLFALTAGTPVNAQSIALVQHTSKDAGTTTSSSLAFTSANTAGNWIGVVIRAGALNENISVSDLKGNSYKKALQFNQSVDGFTAAIFYAENISGGANTVTVSDNIAGTLRFAISEYSGVATVNSLDITATAQGRSTTPATLSVNTTANGDLLLGTIMTGNPENFTAGSGYKIEDSVPALPNSKLIMEDQIQVSAGATVVSATMSTTDDWAAAFAAFKAANGAGGSAPTISNLNPNSGGAGTSVIITGTNFLATQAQGSSTVKFNGVQTTPTAWSDTSLTAPVPAGATTGNVVVTVNGLNSNGALFTVPAPPSVTINQAAGQADPTNASPINFTAVFSTAVTGFSNSGVNLSGTAGATTAVVTGSGTTYNVAVSGMTQNGTVIATIPAGVASANGLQNTASTSTDNTVTYNTSVTPPSVALVQHVGKDAGTTTSSSLAFPSSNTAGNWIGVLVRAGALNENISVSDLKGNSYKKALQFNQPADGFSAAIFYAENISGGTNTVTVSDNISGSLRFVIAEYAGIATVNSLDITATATGNSTTPSSAPSVNTTANGDLLLGTIMTGNPQNFTAGLGYKIEDSVPALPGSKLILEDQVQASAGATLVNATMGSADDWGAAVAAFKAASGTSGTAPTITSLNPTSGSTGTPVTITGMNFLATQAQGNSTVKFNGVQATPTAWSDTSITAPAPPGVTTGSVIVNVNGVNSNGVLFTSTNPVVSVTPKRAAITTGQTQTFTATVTGSANTSVTWEVDTVPGGNTTVGTISAAGVYTPPATGGVHGVVARSQANTSVTSPASSVAVTDLTGVFTYHNDISRTGANTKEYALNTSTVTTATFGKLFTCGVDAAIYAQPLWVANLSFGGTLHNVVYVVTQHNSIYAFDADANPCVTLWSKVGTNAGSLIPSGETWTTSGDVSCADLTPDIGIVGTPVIDPVSNTIYLVTKTKTTATATYHQRIHALDLITGAEKTGNPAEISGTVSGNGNGSVNGTLTFDPLVHNQRPGLLLEGGHLIIGWASHCDFGTYHGWVMSYNATTLTQEATYSVTPNGSLGGVWMSGGGLAADSAGNIYFVTGNGTFNSSTNNYGDAIVKLAPPSGGTFNVATFFAPLDQDNLRINDTDLGSGGLVLLPDLPGGTHPQLLAQAGKDARVWIADRNSLGGFSTTSNNVVQELDNAVPGGMWGSPAYWNGHIYFGAAQDQGGNSTPTDPLRDFSFDTTTGVVALATSTAKIFAFTGPTPSVSSNGTTAGTGVLWALDDVAWQSTSCSTSSASSCQGLYGYDATNLGTKLWDSNQAAGNRDLDGGAVKFAVPTVANGKVYVGNQNTLTVYGLLPN